ncbi:hypothetical protein SPKIRA_36590 [Sphingomonas paucimobilis]|nr:hypothetical protein SPKIRA_36590 [Sphingomonas paucimobilis]
MAGSIGWNVSSARVRLLYSVSGRFGEEAGAVMRRALAMSGAPWEEAPVRWERGPGQDAATGRRRVGISARSGEKRAEMT